MTIRPFAIALGVALLAGCTAPPRQDLPDTHPAHPAAAEAPAPPRSQTLAVEPGGPPRAAAPSATATAPAETGTVYTCPHHPEVVSDKPGECPKCHMKLRPKAASHEPTGDGHQGHEGHGTHGGHQ